jgi:MtN3 and saliva related transmembrane protein
MRQPWRNASKDRRFGALARDEPRHGSLRSHVTDLVTILGAGAALCSTTSFAPQAWRIIRTGDTKAISPPMYILTVGAFALWLAYGVLKSEWPLIATNAPCLALSTFILTMTLLPGRRRRALAAKLDPGGAREVATDDPEQSR